MSNYADVLAHVCATNISCTSCKILLSSCKEDILFFFPVAHKKRITYLRLFLRKTMGQNNAFCATCQSTKDAGDVFLLCCFCQQEVLLLETTITCTVLALRNHCLVLQVGSCYLPHQTGTGTALLHSLGFIQFWVSAHLLSTRTDAQ